jgi:hypothetical protein
MNVKHLLIIFFMIYLLCYILNETKKRFDSHVNDIKTYNIPQNQHPLHFPVKGVDGCQTLYKKKFIKKLSNKHKMCLNKLPNCYLPEMKDRNMVNLIKTPKNNRKQERQTLYKKNERYLDKSSLTIQPFTNTSSNRRIEKFADDIGNNVFLGKFVSPAVCLQTKCKLPNCHGVVWSPEKCYSLGVKDGNMVDLIKKTNNNSKPDTQVWYNKSSYASAKEIIAKLLTHIAESITRSEAALASAKLSFKTSQEAANATKTAYNEAYTASVAADAAALKAKLAVDTALDAVAKAKAIAATAAKAKTGTETAEQIAKTKAAAKTLAEAEEEAKKAVAAFALAKAAADEAKNAKVKAGDALAAATAAETAAKNSVAKAEEEVTKAKTAKTEAENATSTAAFAAAKSKANTAALEATKSKDSAATAATAAAAAKPKAEAAAKTAKTEATKATAEAKKATAASGNVATKAAAAAAVSTDHLGAELLKKYERIMNKGML